MLLGGNCNCIQINLFTSIIQLMQFDFFKSLNVNAIYVLNDLNIANSKMSQKQVCPLKNMELHKSVRMSG